MYLQHFNMQVTPFALTPNTGFFFGLPTHVEALQVLQMALQTGEGFIKVTGEVGTGKTLLCRKLLNELPEEYHCAYLPNPYLTPLELRTAVAHELGVEIAPTDDQQQLSGLIQQRLLSLGQQNKKVVLVMDETQALPDESLEALRLFTNLETESRKLLQVVLFGQPELDKRLSEEKFRQLRQRITFSYCLRPLTVEEVDAYLKYRIAVAGYQGVALFNDSGSRYIAKASRGIPRLINIIAHKALLLTYGEGKQTVKMSFIRAAVADTEDATQSAPSWWIWISILLLISALSMYATKEMIL